MPFIQGVSLPRSGHNMLVGHLQQYFGGSHVCASRRKRRLSLLEKIKCPSPSIRPPASTDIRRDQESHRVPAEQTDQGTCAFHYCEYYYACRSVPCIHAQNAFQKSHDFALDLPVEPRQRYLIQSRNSVDLLISWFELRLKKNRETDSQQGFDTFVSSHQNYLAGFRRKWIESQLPNRLLLDYDQYLKTPVAVLRQAVEFFSPEQAVDDERIRKIVIDVRPAKDNRSFRFACDTTRHQASSRI